jgi:nitrate/nitrite transport system ATP-binding protein
MPERYISIEGISRSFRAPGNGNTMVFQNLWFHMARGEFLAIIGHSGCGKTTILNILAGLDKPAGGAVIVDGQPIEGCSLSRAVIFQSHALLPWKTVLGNVAYAVTSRWPEWPRAKVRAKAMEAIRLVHLEHAAGLKPAQLSGGMKQRVGIARAFSIDPKILLMDEPFSALDALTRGSLQDEVRKICLETGQTAFLITHDVDEAIYLADKIVLMTNGPDAKIAEIVNNPLPKERMRHEIHRHPAYYPVRNHIIDFLITRSKNFYTEIAGAAWDPKHPPLVNPLVYSNGHGGPGPVAVKPADAPAASVPVSSSVKRSKIVTREQLTEKILDIKRSNGWSWKHICNEIGGMSPVLVVGALLGQMKLVKPLAKKAATLFGLSEAEERMLNEVPNRGTPMPPADPLIYRFYELVMVNGPAWKALIEDEFGDGIMSAIDFDMQIERLPNPKGDRVKITMSGKFLPYRYYGNEEGVPDYGLKEE